MCPGGKCSVRCYIYFVNDGKKGWLSGGWLKYCLFFTEGCGVWERSISFEWNIYINKSISSFKDFRTTVCGYKYKSLSNTVSVFLLCHHTYMQLIHRKGQFRTKLNSHSNEWICFWGYSFIINKNWKRSRKRISGAPQLCSLALWNLFPQSCVSMRVRSGYNTHKIWDQRKKIVCTSLIN